MSYYTTLIVGYYICYSGGVGVFNEYVTTFFIKTTAYLEFVEVCDCLEGGGVVGQVCYVWRLPSTPPRVGGVVVLVERPRSRPTRFGACDPVLVTIT